MECAQVTVSSNELMKGLGSAVITRRLQLNINQDNLCKTTGINRSLVVRIESGLVDVDLVSLHKIASALDCTVSTLLEMAEVEARA